MINRRPVNRLLLSVLVLFSLSLQAQQGDFGIQEFKKHSAPVKALAFSVDGEILASGGDDKMIYLWELQHGELIASIENAFSIKSLQFTADGNLLAACGKDIKLMDRQGKLIRTYSGYTTDIWSIGYNKVTQQITAGSYARSVRVWDFTSGKLLLTLEGHEKSCLPVAINPAGNQIASGSLDKSVRLWDAATGKLMHTLALHSENIFAVAYHPSGKYLVSASADKTLRLWSADSGKIIRTFTGHPGAIFDVQFSSNGHHMLSCDARNNIILWETATGKKLYVFSDHQGAVNTVRFNGDASGFASGSDDQKVRYQPLNKEYFLTGTYFEKEIEAAVAGSALFEPRKTDESKQDYTARENKADTFLRELYNQYYLKYIEMLDKLPMEGKENK